MTTEELYNLLADTGLNMEAFAPLEIDTVAQFMTEHNYTEAWTATVALQATHYYNTNAVKPCCPWGAEPREACEPHKLCTTHWDEYWGDHSRDTNEYKHWRLLRNKPSEQ